MQHRVVGRGKLGYHYGWLVTSRPVEDGAVFDSVRYRIHPSAKADVDLAEGNRAEILGVEPYEYVAGIRWTEQVEG